MAVIFSDGFESGDTSAWDTSEGTVTVQGVTVHHGSWAATHENDGNWSWATTRKWISSVSEIYFWCAVYIDSQPGENYYVSFGDSNFANAIILFGAVDSTHWRIKNQCGGINYDSGATTVPTGEWVEMSGYAKIDGTTGAVWMKINGVEVINQTNIDTNDYGNIASFVVGAMDWGTSAFDTILDCCAVGDAEITSDPFAAAGISIPVAMHHLGMMGTGPIGSGDADGSIP